MYYSYKERYVAGHIANAPSCRGKSSMSDISSRSIDKLMFKKENITSFLMIPIFTGTIQNKKFYTELLTFYWT